MLLIVIVSLWVILLGQSTLQGANLSSFNPPQHIPIRMYRLDGNGNIYYQAGTPFPCATPGNREYWGCTAFDRARTKGNQVIIPYPYGATPVPQVAVESDYLPDVAAQEMEVDSAHPLALQAQIIAARSGHVHSDADGQQCEQSSVYPLPLRGSTPRGRRLRS